MTFAKEITMRSAFCVGTVLLIGAAFFVVHDMLSSTIPPMLQLGISSMLISAIVAYFIFRFAQKRQLNIIFSSCLAGVAVFSFFSIWIVLWFVSEQLLIDHYLRVRGGGDTGYNYFYPGASGMGYAEGLSEPSAILKRVVSVGTPAAIFLAAPFGAILTSFKWKSEQGGDGDAEEAV